jgi:putative FmdB family regulatory protein
LPTYEYHCDSCEKNFDLVQSFHDDPLTHCPTCGSPVRKVFGNVGIVFKGSGFYKTDSRNGSSGKKPESTEAALTPPSDSERSASPAETSSSTPSDATAKPPPSPSTSSPDKSSSDKAKTSTGGKSSGAGTPAS